MPTTTRSTNIRPLLPVYLVIFVAFIGYAMMVNFFVPLLMHNHGFLPATASNAQRSTAVGILLAIYPIGQFFGSPILGALSDRHGRKPILLVSLAVAVVCYAIIAFAIRQHNLILLGFACLVGGLSESNIAIAQSAVADVAAPQDRGRLFAYIYTACSMGYISGPLIGGDVVQHAGFSAPFWGVVVLLVVAILWTLVSFRETHPADRSRALDYRAAMMNLTTVFTDRPIRRLYLINFVFYLTIFGFFRVILIYMADKWNMLAHESGVYYSYYSAMSLVASLFIVGPLLKRIPLKTAAIATAVLAGVVMCIVVVPQSKYFLWITAGPCCLIATLTLASCATLLSNSVAPERQGSVMGNNQALQVGAEAVGALVGGLLAAVVATLPLIAFGILLVAGGLMLLPVQAEVAAVPKKVATRKATRISTGSFPTLE
jgi:DHA1 family tetracycline resistance protein-like MFS transporter